MPQTPSGPPVSPASSAPSSAPRAPDSQALRPQNEVHNDDGHVNNHIDEDERQRQLEVGVGHGAEIAVEFVMHFLLQEMIQIAQTFSDVSPSNAAARANARRGREHGQSQESESVRSNERESGRSHERESGRSNERENDTHENVRDGRSRSSSGSEMNGIIQAAGGTGGNTTRSRRRQIEEILSRIQRAAGVSPRVESVPISRRRRRGSCTHGGSAGSSDHSGRENLDDLQR